jgi:hypothetical protein
MALIFSAISVFISYNSLHKQRKYNIRSVRPILHVGQWHYENDQCVTLYRTRIHDISISTTFTSEA